MDFKTVLGLIIKDFNKEKVRYGLIGGFALGIWGVARSTIDLDFLVHRDDLNKIAKIMRLRSITQAGFPENTPILKLC